MMTVSPTRPPTAARLVRCEHRLGSRCRSAPGRTSTTKSMDTCRVMRTTFQPLFESDGALTHVNADYQWIYAIQYAPELAEDYETCAVGSSDR